MVRELSSQGLTDKQAAFALEYAMNGGNATAAAKSAGYSEKSAHEIARQLLELQHIHDAIHTELMRQRYRSGAIGLEAMIRIANNDMLPAAARVSAARALMEHAGLLGSAKDVAAMRQQADQKKAAVDYREVLSSIALQTRQ